ncbi:DUF1682-domain-containing protein [Tilletiaria anomala UBC 951]|uniref:DUF1682-domain-containing protein n=1 Tax=Tilletiaria anomala (strain ATCC 24038 / CBS 436.72 / UBC 951) TaxID=1037660 RepID=A0A066WKE3_TILAU|nr:DUF1682-domain-containing protein [Tilletiaria anomala UBC 951]KDN53043.1 DUF1682-domain-containing protein [Tilletiaria anomala UBC 951]
MDRFTKLGSAFNGGASAAATADGPTLTARKGFHLIGAAYFNPADFKLEGIFVVGAIAYIIIFAVMRARNRKAAYAWVRTAMPELQEEFALIANQNPYSRGPLLWNGAGEAALYATGRRGVDRFQAFFHFLPLHDPLFIIGRAFYDNFSGGLSHDRSTLTLTLTLSQTTDNIIGVFALVDKSVLRATRTSKRFDLTFTKLIEAENAATQRGLSNQWAILSENGDLTDLWLGEINDKGQAQRQKVGIQKLLDDSPAGKWLESLVISDQPTEKPPGPLLLEDRPRKITLTLRMPRSASQARETLPLLGLALSLADGIALSTGSQTSSNPPLRIRQDTLARLRKTRAEVDKQLEEESTREEREAEQEAKAEAKAKAEKAKFEKLSPAEQERRKEIERKRAMKKSMKTVKH